MLDESLASTGSATVTHVVFSGCDRTQKGTNLQHGGPSRSQLRNRGSISAALTHKWYSSQTGPGQSGVGWNRVNAAVIKSHYVTLNLSLDLGWPRGSLRGTQHSHDIRNRKRASLGIGLCWMRFCRRIVVIHFEEHTEWFRKGHGGSTGVIQLSVHRNKPSWATVCNLQCRLQETSSCKLNSQHRVLF